MIKALLKENLVFLIVSFLAFSSTPALVQAQASDYTPVPFTETLTLSRGSVSPPSPNSFYLGRDDYCEITQSEWGWQSCASIDAFLLGGAPGVDTAIIEKPVSDGYVTYDDWNDADRDEEIAAIETELALSMRSQSEATGQDIHFLGWRAYPTLDQQKNYLYYATDIEWDGERLINITATIFDRRGYVTFSIVPLSSELNEAQAITTAAGIKNSWFDGAHRQNSLAASNLNGGSLKTHLNNQKSHHLIESSRNWTAFCGILINGGDRRSTSATPT